MSAMRGNPVTPSINENKKKNGSSHLRLFGFKNSGKCIHGGYDESRVGVANLIYRGFRNYHWAFRVRGSSELAHCDRVSFRGVMEPSQPADESRVLVIYTGKFSIVLAY